eukprot:scaffold153321_cov22-Tisochrysis_lutea.AAC.1
MCEHVHLDPPSGAHRQKLALPHPSMLVAIAPFHKKPKSRGRPHTAYHPFQFTPQSLPQALLHQRYTTLHIHKYHHTPRRDTIACTITPHYTTCATTPHYTITCTITPHYTISHTTIPRYTIACTITPPPHYTISHTTISCYTIACTITPPPHYTISHTTISRYTIACTITPPPLHKNRPYYAIHDTAFVLLAVQHHHYTTRHHHMHHYTTLHHHLHHRPYYTIHDSAFVLLAKGVLPSDPPHLQPQSPHSSTSAPKSASPALDSKTSHSGGISSSSQAGQQGSAEAPQETEEEQEGVDFGAGPQGVPCLFGVTNLFFVKALTHWPSILAINGRSSSESTRV